MHVGHEHRRFGGDQAQRLQQRAFLVAELQRAHRPALVQRGLDFREDLHQLGRLLVVAGLGRLGIALQALVDGAQVGQAQLGLDHLDVGNRVDLAGHVDDVRVVEAAHHVDDGIGLANVRQELVAQAFALARTGHQARDIDKLDNGRHDAFGLDDGRQLRQPRIGQFDDADVRLDGAERIVFRSDARLGQRIEQGGLPHIRQPDDPALQAHGCSRNSSRKVYAMACRQGSGRSAAQPRADAGLGPAGPRCRRR